MQLPVGAFLGGPLQPGAGPEAFSLFGANFSIMSTATSSIEAMAANLAGQPVGGQPAGRDRLPGAELLERRLRRAERASAEERTPDEAAFVESMHLLRGVCELLPLSDDEEPLLPAGPATRRRALLAMLAVARCMYICPYVPQCDRPWPLHLQAYARFFSEAELAAEPTPPPQAGSSHRRTGSGRGSGSPAPTSSADGAPLSCLLALMFRSGQAESLELLEMAQKAAALLEQPATRKAVQQQLGQLAAVLAGKRPEHPLHGMQVPTHHELLYACWGLAFDIATVLVGIEANAAAGRGPPAGRPWTPLSEAGLRLARQAEQAAARKLLALEQDDPRSLHAAATAGMWQATGQGNGQAVARLQRCVAAARQAGSGYWRLKAAPLLLAARMETAGSGPRGRAELQAALEEYQQSGELLPRCHKRLPSIWVDPLQADYDSMQAQLPDVQAQLGGTVHLTVQEAVARMLTNAAAVPATSSICDGCGVVAVGLRRCAGCYTARYCSNACQVSHWKHHRQSCRQPEA